MSITFVFSCYKVIVFTFMIQEQLITSSFRKNLPFLLIYLGDSLADTAILGTASKKEPLCSCNEHTSRARLQLKKKALSGRRICQHATILEGQSSALDWIHILHF